MACRWRSDLRRGLAPPAGGSRRRHRPRRGGKSLHSSHIRHAKRSNSPPRGDGSGESTLPRFVATGAQGAGRLEARRAVYPVQPSAAIRTSPAARSAKRTNSAGPLLDARQVRRAQADDQHAWQIAAPSVAAQPMPWREHGRRRRLRRSQLGSRPRRRGCGRREAPWSPFAAGGFLGARACQATQWRAYCSGLRARFFGRARRSGRRRKKSRNFS